MRSINKKGQVLNAVSSLVIGIMVLIFIIFAVLFGISALKPTTFFTSDINCNTGFTFNGNGSTGDLCYNNTNTASTQTPTGTGYSSLVATKSVNANLTSGVAQFGGYIPIILIILGVVLAISGIAILIAYVRRMQGGSSGSL